MTKWNSGLKKNITLLAFSLPALVLFTTFVVLPFIQGVRYSVHDWDGISPDMIYVGFENYLKLFKDEHFLNALSFTIKFTIVTVITQNLGALIIANLLDNLKRFRNALRGLFFLPNILPGVVVSFIWVFIFTKIMPFIAKTPGLEFMGISWFSKADTAFWATIIVAFWLGVGYLTIIYLAGLTTIDKSVIEASVIDGANRFQQLFRIKVPLLMPSIIIGLFLITMNGLKQFEIVFLMTGGGPFRSTETLALLSYNTAYSRNNFGQATAQAIVLFVLVAVVTITQLVVLKKKEVER